MSRNPFFSKLDKFMLMLGLASFMGLVVGALTRTDSVAIGSFFLLLFTATWLHFS